MSDRRTWESRYGEPPAEGERPPSHFLAEHLTRLPRGRALDVACGDGRHALYLARRGWRVDAVDFSHAALVRLLAAARREGLVVHAIQADLEDCALRLRGYDVVLNVRYLQRTLIDALKGGVRSGGAIVFETFIRDQQQLGHPRNPRFLLERGELAARFADFEILAHEEGRCATESGDAFLARLLARRP
jgi:SAM-dependent methyltransferase